MKYIFPLLVLFSFLNIDGVEAQFAPQYPLEGNDAIYKTDARIKSWATGVTIDRGWMDIADTTLGKASAGLPENALGVSNAMVVSLGDGGSALLTFAKAIKNGAGPDFAVFENAFANPEEAAEAFLELAFVEVSSDGERFVRFPAICNFQTDSQISNFMYLDASLVHNLAGKYISGAGTPFDLEELKDSVGLDVDNIRYVRIVDVVGSIDERFARYDSRVMVINGPYPSVFPSCGFDLEAVAVLHEGSTSGIPMQSEMEWTLFPNPAGDILNIKVPNAVKPYSYRIYDFTGRILKSGEVNDGDAIGIHDLKAGIYFIEIGNAIQTFVKQ